MKKTNKGSIVAGLLALQFVMQAAGVQMTAFAEDAVLPTESAESTADAAPETTASATEATVAESAASTEVVPAETTEVPAETTTAKTDASPIETEAPAEAPVLSTEAAVEAEAADSLTISSQAQIPAEIREGAVVSISGTLNSANSKAINKVRVEILTRAGAVMYYGEATPNTTTYDLKKLDNNLLFNRLTAGEYIYRISATNTAGASFNQDVPFKVLAANELDYLKLEGTLTNIPATLNPGTPVTVSGTVKSGQTSITSVSIKITDQNGKEYCPNKVVPGKNSYDLKGLDNIITFDKLPQGTYTFRVIASNKANTDKVLQEVTFNVGAGAPASTTTETMSLMNATGLPDTMTAGSDYAIRGSLSSSGSNLRSLFVGVYNTAGSVVAGRTIALNTQSYDLSNMDTYVSFSGLSAGNYLFAIIASNGTKTNEVLFTKSFNVVGNAPVVTADDIALSGATEIPNSIKSGTSLSVRGSVKSDFSNLRTLTVAVYDLNGNFKTGGTINPAAKESDLSYLDRYLAFQNLPAGSYHYYVMASNDKNSNKVLAHKQFAVENGVAVNDNISISGQTVLPASITVGSAQNIKGVVTSGSSSLTTLFAGVYNGAGQVVTGRTINPGSTSCDLATRLNPYIEFNKLPAGEYLYAVIASNASTINQVLVSQKIKVTASASVPISITNGTVVPANFKQGDALKINGIVTSDTKMTSLFAGIYDSNNKVVTGKTVVPNSTTYNINQLDANVRFDLLQPGTYTYAVIASNASNTNFTVSKQVFTVGSNASTDKLSITNAPSIPNQIAVGKAVSVHGTVTSASSNITSLTVGVVQNNTWMVYKTVAPNAKSYNIGNLDKYITFNTLKDGKYTFVVLATNGAYKDEKVFLKDFTVGNGNTQTDTITIANGTNVPASMNKGSAVAVKGTVSASSNLTSVTVCICDANGNAVYSKTVAPNAKSYTISRDIDNAMYFNRLAAGNYSYRVIASTAATSNYVVVNQAFTVK